MLRDVVICTPLRTPVGRMGGALAPLSALELATLVVRAVIERSGVESGCRRAPRDGPVLSDDGGSRARAGGGTRRGPPGHDDRLPARRAVRIRPAGDPQRRDGGADRRHRPRDRGRRRVDEQRAAVHRAGSTGDPGWRPAAARRAHPRARDRRRPGLSDSRRQRRHRGDAASRVRHLARGTGCLRAPFAPARRRRAGVGRLRRRARAGRGPGTQGVGRRRPRRASARRHLARGARRAAAGARAVGSGCDGDRRQLERPERCRRGLHRDDPGARRRARARAHPATRLLGDGRRRPTPLRHRPGRGREPRARAGRHRIRRPRRDRAQRGVRGAGARLPRRLGDRRRTTRASIRAAAASRSGIRSRRPGCGCSRRSTASCATPAAATPSRRCASAAARASPPSSSAISLVE